MRYPKNAKFLGRAVECALFAAYDAADSSGLDWNTLDKDRIGLFTASGQTGLEYHTFFPALAVAWEDGRPRDFKYLGRREARLIDRYFSLRTLANGGLAVLSMELEARGPASNHVHGDTAFVRALGCACRDLLDGRCDIAVAGGYDSLVTASNYLGYVSRGLLAAGESADRLLPFDCRGSGVVLGDGAAFFVLERDSDARRRGAEVIAELSGVGLVQDCCPSANDGWRTAELGAAIAGAGGFPEECECLVAHGIGRPDSDLTEARAWEEFVPAAMPITAFKGITGYLGAATAAVELGLTLLSLRAGFIPPITGLEYPTPGIHLNLIQHGARPLAKEHPSTLVVSRSWSGEYGAIAAQM
jgi:3-oxoacyl-[acyl-carrier-protein] synthase II